MPNTSLRVVLLITVAFCALPLFLPAQQPDWKVGLAKTKITPPEPVFMAGYASRNKPYDSIHDDLFAKALVLEDDRGSRAIMLTTDLLGFPAKISGPTRQRIAEKTKIPLGAVLINASHTHTGPAVSLDPAPADNRGAADSERTVAYTQLVCDKLVQLAEEAVGKMQPAKLSWGTGVAHFTMNRREVTTDRGIILGVNPRGFADRSVPVLRIDDPTGKLLAVVCGTACHNTTLGGEIYDISGDYAGHAQRLLEEQHPGAMALFVLGCAGDANPYPRGSHAISQTHGEDLAKEASRVLKGKLAPVRGPLQAATVEVSLPLATAPPREQLEKQAAGKGGIATWVAQQMLTRLNAGEKLPTEYACPLAAWQLGDDLTLIALSGEVVSDYVRLLEDALGPTRLWIAAYSNDVYGYLPSARILREGGYETRGLYTGGIGYFAPEAEEVMVRKVRELAKTVGRKGVE